MKKLLFSLPVCLLLAVSTPKANAQVSVSVGIWTPPPEYASVNYYYLPDVNAYYDADAQCYYYNNGYNWISAAYLPGEYRNYDWRNARRFEIREHGPYMRSDFYRSRYEGRQIEAFRHFNNNNYFAGAYRNDNHFNNRNFNRGNDNHFNDIGRRGFSQPNNNRLQREKRGGR